MNAKTAPPIAAGAVVFHSSSLGYDMVPPRHSPVASDETQGVPPTPPPGNADETNYNDVDTAGATEAADAAVAAEAAGTGMAPDQAESTSNAGRQGQPAGWPYTVDHYKFNAETGQWERSTVTRDQFGRQTARTDWTDHGYPGAHTNPHHHTTEWNSQYPDGNMSGPIPGPYPGHQ